MSASSPTEPARPRGGSDDLEPSESTTGQGDQSRRTWAAPGASEVAQELAGPSATEHDADGSEGPMRHRLLARIPGLSRLAEQSGWMEGSTDEPTTDDQGWVYHEGDGEDAFAGWLYHYADGTMVDADGVEYAFPDDSSGPEPTAEAEPEPAPDPEPEPEPVAEEAQPETPAEDDHPRPELALVEDEPDEQTEEADEQTEGREEPVDEAPEAPAAEEAAPAAAAEPEPDPEPEPEPELPAGVPRFVEYSPTHVRGYVLGGVFVLASVAAVLTLFVAVSESSVAALVIAAGCVLLGVVAWWALLAWRPTVVSIRDGVLDITRGGHSDRFELADPSTSVEFSGRPGSPTWTAVIRTRNGPRTMLRSSHVKPRQFERIVRHHRAATAPGEGPTD